MPTVIDSFILEFGLDPKKFSQGQQEALASLRKFMDQAVAGGKEIESQGKKSERFFSDLKRQAIEIGAIALGGKGLKDFLGSIITADAAIGRTAKTLDISAKELSIWQGMATQAGGSAESMTGALQGLSGEVQKFALTGQGSFLPLFNQLNISLEDGNRQLKTSNVLMMELAKAVESMDPARARAMLSMVPGMNEQTINLLLKGTAALKAYRDAAIDAGSTTEQSAQQAAAYERSLANLERSATSLGRTLLTGLAPILSTITDIFTAMFQGNIDLWGTKNGKTPAQERREAAPPKMSGVAPARERENYIRNAARARGIDPDVAMAVARSEGFDSYVGDRGSSFGDFQLHYGGVASGGMAVGGLGDKFTKKTGLNARDPSTWRQQTDFALDEASKGGWGPWHGWKGLPTAGIGPLPSSGAGAGADVNGWPVPGAPAAARAQQPPASGWSRGTVTNTTTINTLNVDAKGADSGEIAQNIKQKLQLENLAAPANTGRN